jgi:hypothetical protein
MTSVQQEMHMSVPTSIMFSFRLTPDIHQGLQEVARNEGLEPAAFVQLLIRQAVADAGVLGDEATVKIRMTDALIRRAVERARELFAAGRFDEHFTLTVFHDLMQDTSYRSDYETVVGGDAYATKLEGKFPLNMYLGWYIKNAVGADPLTGDDGKPRRASVKGQPIQSYTLLKEGKG